MWTFFFFKHWLFLCSTLTRIAQNDLMCMYISCVSLCVHGFMNPLPSWFVCVFFSDVLTYCVMLQAFICYCSSSDVYDVRTCARVYVFFIGIVQRSWACLTWKSAIEIKSLLLLLLLNESERHTYNRICKSSLRERGMEVGRGRQKDWKQTGRERERGTDRQTDRDRLKQNQAKQGGGKERKEKKMCSLSLSLPFTLT